MPLDTLYFYFVHGVTYLATGDKLNRPEFTVEVSAQTAIDFITFIIAVTDIVTFGG